MASGGDIIPFQKFAVGLESQARHPEVAPDGRLVQDAGEGANEFGPLIRHLDDETSAPGGRKALRMGLARGDGHESRRWAGFVAGSPLLPDCAAQNERQDRLPVRVRREGLAGIIAGLGERKAAGVEHGMPGARGNRS
jgi:hypothetical protein